MTQGRWDKMTPGERLEYHIRHMADPVYRKWNLGRLQRSGPAGRLLYEIESHSRAYRLQKRPPTTARPLKSFNPETIYRIISNLQTPATFSKLKNDKDRLNKSVPASSLRQYIDALLTWGYVTLAGLKIKEKEYPYNFVPRSDFTVYYKQATRGKRFVRLYKEILSMTSEIQTKGHMDRL